MNTARRLVATFSPAMTFPSHIPPMLAQLGSLPDDDERWAYEVKWDGGRAITYITGGGVQVESRNLPDNTTQYPELQSLQRIHGDTILDGEIVALDQRGRPSFQLLQSRMHLGSAAAVARVAAQVSIVYMIFDVLYRRESIMSLPYIERRAAL